MSPSLLSAFRRSLEGSGSWVHPDLQLSYADRKHLEAGEPEAVATEKLPVLERQIWWTKTTAGVSAALLALGLVWTTLQWGATDPIEAGEAQFLFLAFCMGGSAIGGLWQALRLAEKRLLCELVIDAASEKAASEKASVGARTGA
jgi:type VI protein secretion system component VasK